MYTNTTRITGLSGSGIDTDTMIEKLMYAESSKLYRYQRSVTWKTWQQEAYRNVITKFQDFQNKWLSSVGTSSSLKYSTAFASFKNSVKSSKGGDSEAITINKSTSSQKYEIKVKQLAQSDTYVSTGKAGKAIKSSGIDIGDLADKVTTADGMSFSVTLDGKAKEITLKGSDFAGVDFSVMSTADKAAAIESKINEKLEKAFGTETKNGATNAKVSVTLDASGNFSVNENLGHEISLTGSGVSTESSAVFASGASGLSGRSGSFNVTVDGKTYSVVVMPSADSTTSLADKINAALTKAIGPDGKETDISDALSAKIDDNDNLVLSAGANDVSISNGDDTLAGVINATTLKSSNDLKNYFNIDTATTKVSNTTTLGDIFDSSIWTNSKASITINGEKIEFSQDDNLATFLENINSSDAGVKVSYNATNQKFTFESSESGAIGEIDFGTDSDTNNVLTAMGFDPATMKTDSAQHTKVAQDAILKIDGVETTRTSNTIDLEGMNITLNKVTEDYDSVTGEVITLGNETDTDAIYETIKTFVDEYNTLIEDLNKQVKETRAKSDDYTYYEPLTDQEKKEMDEDEIKLWEEKAKTGLLHRDTTITNILSKMRSAIYSPITKVDGTKIALYNFGITTSSNYTDNGKLVIDEEKLKNAITNNLDDIQAIFTGNGTQSGKGLAENLEDIIETAIGTKGSLREKAGIVGTASVNENSLSKEIKALNEKITLEKERLVTKENKYYSMFSSMESSIMNSNSQLDALFSMMGQ